MDDREVVLYPSWIARLRGRLWIDMIAKTTSAKMDIKKMVPVVVIVGREVESDGDERGDIGNCVG